MVHILTHPTCVVHCNLAQVHTPRVLAYSFWSRLLALLREEFTISKLTLHSYLGRRAASRRALPCPSSVLFFISEQHRKLQIKKSRGGNCLLLPQCSYAYALKPILWWTKTFKKIYSLHSCSSFQGDTYIYFC